MVLKKLIIIRTSKSGRTPSTNDKYFIHIKAVQQYYDDERSTDFEQNINLRKFYFDLPISKGAHSSIEHCSLKRTIFTVETPIPSMERRVKIINVETEVHTPIQFSIQNLKKQITLIKYATENKDGKSLQLLLQGTLLVQVNEGPHKIAEVFLKKGVPETNDTKELREIFKEFIKVNEKAVLVHSDYAKSNSVFNDLQRELEIGLNRLTATLQPYLKD